MTNTMKMQAAPDEIYDTFRNAGFLVSIVTKNGEPVGMMIHLGANSRFIAKYEIKTVLWRNDFVNKVDYFWKNGQAIGIFVEC